MKHDKIEVYALSSYEQVVVDETTTSLLNKVIAKWHMQMTPQQLLALRTNLMHLVHKYGKDLPVGTGFSGCDIASHMLTEFSRAWSTMFGVEINFKVLLACERSEKKRAFLQSQHELVHLVEDMATLKQDRLTDVRTNSEFLMPWLFGFFAGFPCVSRSSLNKNAPANLGCIAKGTGETGAGYTMIVDFLTRHSPAFVVLENNPGLLQSDEDGSCDADFVKQNLFDIGYMVTQLDVECRDHGSFAARRRLLWVAFRRGLSEVDPTTKIHDTMLTLRTTPMQIEHIICNDEEKRAATMMRLNLQSIDTMARPSKLLKTDPNFCDEHHFLYKALGFSWPPKLGPEFKGSHMLSERQQQIWWLLHTLFECPPNSAQFVDLNPRLGRLVGLASHGSKAGFKACKEKDLINMDIDVQKADLRDPWSTNTMFTLTGQGLVVMRQNREGLGVSLRVLESYEHMAFIGWDQHLWTPLTSEASEVCSHDLVRSLAGNAFSIWNIGPALLSGIASFPITAA